MFFFYGYVKHLYGSKVKIGPSHNPSASMEPSILETLKYSLTFMTYVLSEVIDWGMASTKNIQGKVRAMVCPNIGLS